MTADQARELFSEALEGELAGDTRAEFEAALQASPELRAEYDDFRQTLSLTRNAPAVQEGRDLLPGIQKRLRARSKGRFYPDRFSQRVGLGAVHPVVLALLMLLVLAAAWAGLEALSTIQLPR